jgi:hypothetical protein
MSDGCFSFIGTAYSASTQVIGYLFAWLGRGTRLPRNSPALVPRGVAARNTACNSRSCLRAWLTVSHLPGAAVFLYLGDLRRRRMPSLLLSWRPRIVQDRRGGPAVRRRWQTPAGTRQRVWSLSSTECGTAAARCWSPNRSLRASMISSYVASLGSPQRTSEAGQQADAWLLRRVPICTALQRSWTGGGPQPRMSTHRTLVPLLYRRRFLYCRELPLPLGPRLLLAWPWAHAVWTLLSVLVVYIYEYGNMKNVICNILCFLIPSK